MGCCLFSKKDPVVNIEKILPGLNLINNRLSNPLCKFVYCLHPMKKLIILSFFLLPLLAMSQTDLLILKKRGMHVTTYTVGSELTMRSVYDQWFQGTISYMRNDSIF